MEKIHHNSQEGDAPVIETGADVAPEQTVEFSQPELVRTPDRGRSEEKRAGSLAGVRRKLALGVMGVSAFLGAASKESKAAGPARPASQPTSRMTTKPTSGPSTQPASRPSSQPASQPATAPSIEAVEKPADPVLNKIHFEYAKLKDDVPGGYHIEKTHNEYSFSVDGDHYKLDKETIEKIKDTLESSAKDLDAVHAEMKKVESSADFPFAAEYRQMSADLKNGVHTHDPAYQGVKEMIKLTEEAARMDTERRDTVRDLITSFGEKL